MFDFVKSSFDTVAQRVTNPLIGAYVMAWVAVNHKGVGQFMFAADDAVRREIIAGYSVGVDEVWAIGMAVGYLALSNLVSPWVQSKVEACRYQWVEKSDIDAKRAEQYHRSLAKYESSEKYIESKTEDKLAQLDAKTKQLLARTQQMDTTIQKTKSELAASSEEEMRQKALYESAHQQVLVYKGACAQMFSSIVELEETLRQLLAANTSNASEAYTSMQSLQNRAQQVQQRLNDDDFHNKVRTLGLRMASDSQLKEAVPSHWLEINKSEDDAA